MFAYIHIHRVDEPYENDDTLREQTLSLKFFQPLKLLMYLGKRFRAFHALIIESVNQRYSIKVGKKRSANSALSAKVCAST